MGCAEAPAVIRALDPALIEALAPARAPALAPALLVQPELVSLMLSTRLPIAVFSPVLSVGTMQQSHRIQSDILKLTAVNAYHSPVKQAP